MPLKTGKSKKTISANISELMHGKMGASRKKASKTLAKKRGVTTKRARQIQAVAIAYSKARKARGARP